MKMLIAAAIMALTIGTAHAAQCVPLAEYDTRIAQAGIPREAIVTAKGEEFVTAYNAALGFAVPEDSNPIGMFFIVGPQVVLIAIVEREGCVKYSARVPLWKHEQALNGI